MLRIMVDFLIEHKLINPSLKKRKSLYKANLGKQCATEVIMEMNADAFTKQWDNNDYGNDETKNQ